MDFLTEDLIYQKSPQQLTAMLYEKAIMNIEESVVNIQHKDFYRANEKLQQTNDILHRLGVGLKYEAGVIAEQLDMLYNYMANQLVEANIKKDIVTLTEVRALLVKISQAWNEAFQKTDGAITIKRQVQNRLSTYEQQISITKS
ncbi:flagellar export chaperone FliS [Priestia megaterium]|nr:flagellar export chaperone FliS [Priestia megaterium]